MRELLEDIRLSKVAYLIENMEKKNIDEKIKAYKKLEKMKITKEIGIYLIQNSTRDFNLNDDLGGISSSLIELCFKEYFIEYTPEIEKVFKDLDEKAQDRVLYLLTTIDSEDTLVLYADLVLKYYKNRKAIPIGDLQNKPLAYPYLFPKLYKTFKFTNIQNNILLLLSSYLNAGTVLKDDLKKNNKLVTDLLVKIFDKACSYKFKTTFEGLKIEEYKELRYYLEMAINVETYVSGKKTKACLTKLLKKHDNQIKLFIIDNYLRKNQKIDKLSFTEMAKDDASRYALYELLTIYEKTNLMPKKYAKQELLAQSEFYTNFLISSFYKEEPIDLKLHDTKEVDGYKYYVFKFKYTYKFSSLTGDYLTDYISSQIGIDKYNGKEITSDFVGVSGGYSLEGKSLTLAKIHQNLLVSKISENDDIDKIVLDLIKQKEENKEEKIDKKKKKTKKEKVKKEKKKKEKIIPSEEVKEVLPTIEETKDENVEEENKEIPFEEEKTSIEEDNEISFESEDETSIKDEVVDEKKREKLLKKEKRREKKRLKKEREAEDKKLNDELANSLLQDEEVVKKRKFHLFSYLLLFLFAVYLGLFIYCLLYIYGVGSLNDGVTEDIIKPVELSVENNFTEISAPDIFNQDGEYFVLLFDSAYKKKTKYYKYINEYAKRNYKFYYVDLRKDENHFLYEPNTINFTLTTDRLLKVKDREYEYYVDGKTNILNEMQTQIELIILQEQEAAKEAKKEEK